MLDKAGLYKYECSLKEAISRGKILVRHNISFLSHKTTDREEISQFKNGIQKSVAFKIGWLVKEARNVLGIAKYSKLL